MENVVQPKETDLYPVNNCDKDLKKKHAKSNKIKGTSSGLHRLNSMRPSVFTFFRQPVNVIRQHLWMRWVGNSQMWLKECQKPVAWLMFSYGSVEEMFKQLSWSLRLEKRYYFLLIFFSVERKIFVMDKPHHTDHLSSFNVLCPVPLILWNPNFENHNCI